MRYADECCTYTEINSPEHAYVFTGKCRMTGETVSVTVPGKELYAYRKGGLIQDAMPSVSAADREFLMTGLSGEAWDKTFGEED
jgi:hypothetical protein